MATHTNSITFKFDSKMDNYLMNFHDLSSLDRDMDVHARQQKSGNWTLKRETLSALKKETFFNHTMCLMSAGTTCCNNCSC